MIWKFLLTAAVLVAAYYYLRARLRRPDGPGAAPRPPLLPVGTPRLLAAAVLGVMLLGSGWYLYRGWAFDQEVVAVQVVNANTGAITVYQAQRGAVAGRVFRTLDGREIRLADVERMILTRAGQGF